MGLDPEYPVGQSGHYMILVGLDGTSDKNTVYVVPGRSAARHYSNSTTTSASNTPVYYTVKQFLTSWRAMTTTC